MTAKNKLLDKAREVCSLATDKALAERIGISPQLLSNWRKGHELMADDRIAQVARIAHEDAGVWLTAIRAEQTEGATSKAWADVAKRLGFAACLVVALGQAGWAKATSPSEGATSHNVSNLLRRLVAALRHLRIGGALAAPA